MLALIPLRRGGYVLFPACTAFHFVPYFHIQSLKDVCTVDAVQTWTGYILSFTVHAVIQLIISNLSINLMLKHIGNTVCMVYVTIKGLAVPSNKNEINLMGSGTVFYYSLTFWTFSIWCPN